MGNHCKMGNHRGWRFVTLMMLAFCLLSSGTGHAQSIALESVSSSPPFTAVANAVGGNIEERGFLWWLPDGTESGLFPEGSGEGSFRLDIPDLKTGLTYHVKAYINVDGQIIHSNEQVFTVSGVVGAALPGVVTTGCRANVDGTVTVSGKITDFGASPVREWGFVYDVQPGPVLPAPGMTGGVCEGSHLDKDWNFIGVIRGLSPGTWYVRAYARNENPGASAGKGESVGYGQEQSFTISSDGRVETIDGEAPQTAGPPANPEGGMGAGQVSLTILNSSSENFTVSDPVLTTSTGARLTIPFAQASIRRGKSASFAFDCPDMSQITDSCTCSFTITPLNKPSHLLSRTLGEAGKILEITDSLFR